MHATMPATHSSPVFERTDNPSALDPVALTPAMADVLHRCHVFAPAATPIVLHGESGTGKTFIAEYIHALSGRGGGFHPFSVGVVQPQLALDYLFGHVPGAYTDARRVRLGRIATAGSGTLLLDDVQNLDLGVQKQLLQVLDRGTYSPVGCDRELTVGCRIILAMAEDPDELVRRGVLLKDLRYRFGMCDIRVPPLAERRAEIPLLAQRFLDRCPNETKVSGPSRVAPAAMAWLEAGEYPGNVRQLQGVVVCAYLMAAAPGAAEVRVEHLPDGLCAQLRYQRRGNAEANRRAIERALERTGGNVKAAARVLGVSRHTVTSVLGGSSPGGGVSGDAQYGRV
jgi:DNA-binding NtrC family response regulator